MSLKHDELQMFLKQLKLAEKTNTKLALLIRRTILNIQEEVDREWYKYQEKYHLDNEQMIKYFNKKMSQAEIEKYVENHQYALADFTSFKGKISRLVLLKNHIAHEMNYVQTESINHIEGLLKEVIENTYETVHYNICKNIGFEIQFNRPSKSKIEKILNHQWLDSNWYKRIQNNCGKLQQQVEEVLTSGVLKGSSPQKMAEQLTKCSNYGINASTRLIRTETSHFANKCEMESYSDLGIEKYIWVSTLDSRTCQRASHKCGKSCAELDGTIFEVGGKDSLMPPDDSHVQCRCCTVAYFDEETKNNMLRRAKKNDTGEPVVFKYKNYEEWKADNN